MRISIVIISALTLLAACKNAPKAKDEKTDIANTQQIIDPVCGMIKDSTWTDYALYKGDTVWFCAEAEKTAFLANPARYEKNMHSN